MIKWSVEEIALLVVTIGKQEAWRGYVHELIVTSLDGLMAESLANVLLGTEFAFWY